MTDIESAVRVQCGHCHIASEDTQHKAVRSTKDGQRHFKAKEDKCMAGTCGS
jgi:hypothetical protein